MYFTVSKQAICIESLEIGHFLNRDHTFTRMEIETSLYQYQNSKSTAFKWYSINNLNRTKNVP